MTTSQTQHWTALDFVLSNNFTALHPWFTTYTTWCPVHLPKCTLHWTEKLCTAQGISISSTKCSGWPDKCQGCIALLPPVCNVHCFAFPHCALHCIPSFSSVHCIAFLQCAVCALNSFAFVHWALHFPSSVCIALLQCAFQYSLVLHCLQSTVMRSAAK